MGVLVATCGASFIAIGEAGDPGKEDSLLGLADDFLFFIFPIFSHWGLINRCLVGKSTGKYFFSLLNAFKRANPGLVLFGLLFCTMSVFLRAVKAVLQDQLLEPTAYASRVDLEQGKGGVNGASPPSLSPMHVWALTAPPCTLLAFAYAVTTESLTSAFHELTATSIFFVLISCLSATILNVLGLMSVKQLGAQLYADCREAEYNSSPRALHGLLG